MADPKIEEIARAMIASETELEPTDAYLESRMKLARAAYEVMARSDGEVERLREALKPFAKVAVAYDYWCAEAMPSFSYPVGGTRLELAIHDCPDAIGELAESDFAAARAALPQPSVHGSSRDE